MKDILVIVQEALDDVFFGKVEVSNEEFIPLKSILPDEYITFNLVSGVYTDYANGKPIQRKDNIDVKYYGKSLSKKHCRLEEIEQALISVGFKVVSLPEDLGRDDITGHDGSIMEFSLTRTVKYGA